MSKLIFDGIFLRRINRFVIECYVRNKKTFAYLPNPGRLYELLLPKSRLFLLRQKKGSATIPFKVFGVEKQGMNVLLDTHYTNKVAEELIKAGKIEEFKGYNIAAREVNYMDSRFDFLLRKGRERILLEVKSCTLFNDKIAMFPDAISERAKRHILTLSNIKEEKLKGAILFIINSPKVKYFLPEFHTDPEFSIALLEGKDKLIIKAVKLYWENNFIGWKYADEAEIPWHILEKQNQDKGVYILGLFLPADKAIMIGKLGMLSLKKGYYLYIGSARKNLNKRINHHKRKLKSHFWHIDYLREVADYSFYFAIRIEDDIECEVAKSIREISDGEVKGFGSSDCNCQGHLFWMKNFPIQSRDFINLVQYFRMERILRGYESN